MGRPPLLVGVVSDTHGLVRPAVMSALAGVSHILHAGDVGERAVLEELQTLAPVTAVRGNTDTGAFGFSLPETTQVTLGGTRLYLIHDELRLRFDPEEDGLDAVISGHTHLARNARVGRVLRFNPGSAGPRRPERPVTIGRLRIVGRRIEAQIVELRVR